MRRFYALAMRKKDPIKVYQFISLSIILHLLLFFNIPWANWRHSQGLLIMLVLQSRVSSLFVVILKTATLIDSKS